MKMILNNKSNEVIDVSSFSRTLMVDDPMVKFQLSLTMEGNYSAEGIEYLANYANSDVEKIEIKDDELENALLVISNTNAKLTSLNETCDNSGRHAWASLVIYEEVAEE